MIRQIVVAMAFVSVTTPLHNIAETHPLHRRSQRISVPRQRGHYPKSWHASVQWYPKDQYRMILIADPQGINIRAVKRYLKAVEVLPGCFYGKAKARGVVCRNNLEWTIIDGRLVVGHNPRWPWPAYTEDNRGNIGIERYLHWRKPWRYKNAMAGRFYPPQAEKSRERVMIGFVRSCWVVIRYTGTYRNGLTILKTERLGRYSVMHTDGGSSVCTKARLGSCYAICRRQTDLARR